MRTGLFIIGVVVMVGAVFAWPLDKDTSESSIGRVRSLPNFESIAVSGGIRVEINYKEGDQEVVVEGPNEANISTKVKNGILQIRPNKIGEKVDLTLVKINTTYLDKLQASGASQVALFGNQSATQLKISLSGASSFNSSGNFESLKLACSGASSVKIDGSAKDAKMLISGASHVNGVTFEIERLKLQASGASYTKVNVTNALDVAVSGASEVQFTGGAKLTRRSITGASRLVEL